MATQLRYLNSGGVSRFKEYLLKLRDTKTGEPPWLLLEDKEYSQPVTAEMDIALEDRGTKVFGTRFELGTHLTEVFEPVGKQRVLRERGLWSWLALFYFDQLCPPNAGGRRNPKELYSYILSENFRHHPRHAVRTTYQYVSVYGSKVRFMFSKPMSMRGEIVEQLAARIELASVPSVIHAASNLYQDPETGSFKRGAAGRSAGSISRYVTVLKQFQLTYDLHSLGHERLLELLPKEFDRFRVGAREKRTQAVSGGPKRQSRSLVEKVTGLLSRG